MTRENYLEIAGKMVQAVKRFPAEQQREVVLHYNMILPEDVKIGTEDDEWVVIEIK